MLRGKTVVLGVSGSIAAYKIGYLCKDFFSCFIHLTHSCESFWEEEELRFKTVFLYVVCHNEN